MALDAGPRVWLWDARWEGMDTNNRWLRDSGWWLASGSGGSNGVEAKPTHLLLDGGKARVPDESASLFLLAYANAVVSGKRPCISELRTPVFRLFLDLDIKVASEDALDFDAVMPVVQQCAASFFEADTLRAVVCTTPPKQAESFIKAGRHVVWPSVYVTSSTALAFRVHVVEALETRFEGACTEPWDAVVDARVFRSNGLRMPFSEKGRGNTAVYAPESVWVGEVAEERVGDVSGASAVRAWVQQLSIRVFGVDETPVREGVVVATDGDGDAKTSLCGVSKSLREYEAVLPKLDAALPVQFTGQRFTGLIKTDTCFLLRSSSRYCLNMGRSHNSCGIYWILTPRGVRQACYCRCETTEGRKYGLCKGFRSELFHVPTDVIEAFFGTQAAVEASGFQAAKLPSAKTCLASLDAVFTHSRPVFKSKKRKQRA
jgi:hypothetical protein